MTYKTLAILIAAVVMVSVVVGMAGTTESSAHWKHCPGQSHHNDYSEFKEWFKDKFKNKKHHHHFHYWWKWWKKHHKHHCHPTPTPASATAPPTVKPPTPTPTQPPTPTPSPVPTITPSPTPDPTPEPTPEPTPVPTPTPLPGTDVKVTDLTVNAPASATGGVQFTVSSMASLHNNGPAGAVNVDTTFTLTLPPGCVAPTNQLVVTVPNRSLPASTGVGISRSWGVVCSPGKYTFNVTAGTVISPGQPWSDSNTANNSDSGIDSVIVAAPSPSPSPPIP
jgi:hypothetical protein